MARVERRRCGGLAQAIYDEGRFGDLPILGDALEDAGCDDPSFLAGHCRSPAARPGLLGARRPAGRAGRPRRTRSRRRCGHGRVRGRVREAVRPADVVPRRLRRRHAEGGTEAEPAGGPVVFRAGCPRAAAAGTGYAAVEEGVRGSSPSGRLSAGRSGGPRGTAGGHGGAPGGLAGAAFERAVALALTQRGGGGRRFGRLRELASIQVGRDTGHRTPSRIKAFHLLLITFAWATPQAASRAASSLGSFTPVMIDGYWWRVDWEGVLMLSLPLASPPMS